LARSLSHFRQQPSVIRSKYERAAAGESGHSRGET
jgi:hypothetical protein